MAIETKTKTTLVKQRHPLWVQFNQDWLKWRLCYTGGMKFKESYLCRYSKREHDDDYQLRKKLTYIPGHARSVINIIRNAMAVRLPEVIRKGSDAYMETMETDVDTFRNNMNSYVALEITPMLLTQGKRIVVVDAPPAREGATRAEDEGRPFFFSVNAEDVLSWSYDQEGRIDAILMQLVEDQVDDETKLVVGSNVVYRYMRLLAEGEQKDTGVGPLNGPGVLVQTFNKDGKETTEARVLPLSRVPVVEFSLVDSIMAEVADHQIAMLNLASTDMDFLWRGNFPIYTEQQPKSTQMIRPRGTKGRAGEEVAEDTDSMGYGRDAGTGENKRQRRAGNAKGIAYKEGMERPAFINPATDNLNASMTKQEAIAKEIRILVDLALVSLSVKAIEQSGASKMADRVGEEAGLAYIGRSLETGERELAEIWHEMNGDQTEVEIKYPTDYSVKTLDERREEAKSLRELRSAVRSVTFQREIDKRTADVLLKTMVDTETMDTINGEVDAADYYDDDTERAKVVQQDVLQGIVSKETAARLRGYDEQEPAKARAEKTRDVDSMLGEGRGATEEDRVPAPGQDTEDVTDDDSFVDEE